MNEDVYDIESIVRHDTVAVYESEAPHPTHEPPWEGRVTVTDLRDGKALRVETRENPVTGETFTHELVLVENVKRIIGSDEEAIAILAAAKMSEYGVVEKVETGGRVILVWIQANGCDFSNIGNAFDLDVTEVGPMDAYPEGTGAHDDAPDRAGAFIAFRARGVRPQDADGWGYGSPTHSDRKHGAYARDPVELHPLVFQAADRLELIPEHVRT